MGLEGAATKGWMEAERKKKTRRKGFYLAYYRRLPVGNLLGNYTLFNETEYFIKPSIFKF